MKAWFRSRTMWLIFTTALLFLPMVAFAQEAAAPGLPTGTSLLLLIAGLILGAAIMVLARIAPLTRNTTDDRVLEFLRQAEPTLKRWLDPKDPAVPPSPSNPDGRG